MALRDVTFWSGAGPAGPDAPPARADEVSLFNIVEVREWRDADADAVAVHWMVRGGLWAGSHLRHACRGPLCRIARASLAPKRESAASLVLRVGSFVMADSCPSGKRTEMTVSVESLLAAVGRLPAPQLRAGAWVRRTAEDLQEAARALHGERVLECVNLPGLPSDEDDDSSAIDRWLRAESTFIFGAGVR